MKKIFRNLFVSKNNELEARTKYEIGKIYLRASKMITVENEEDDRDQNWLLEKSTEYFGWCKPFVCKFYWYHFGKYRCYCLEV